MRTRIKDEKLKTCPERDPVFSQLVQELETCSRERGDCDQCPLLKLCVDAFDRLADDINHNKLKTPEYEQFKSFFASLSTQMTLECKK